jgi:cytochrome c peroxidase
MKKSTIFILSFLTMVVASCDRCKDQTDDQKPTPYSLDIPSSLPPMSIPSSNPLTVEGIALGRKLFYDPILSGNNVQSCSNCHIQNTGFAEPFQHSTGIDGIQGNRNAMPLINLGYQPNYFWDGGAADLESQALGPVANPIEMHETWENAVSELRNHAEYPGLFKKAFGIDQITSQFVVRALAQFERTMISGNSKYDRYVVGQENLSSQELLGLQIFTDPQKGDCNHCHVLGSTFSDFEYRNTGLDSIPVDEGRFRITWNNSDKGKFKTPSLRNIEVTAPYMHDGRFMTLLECVEHYNSGFHYAPNLDANLYTVVKGRMSLSEMEAVVAFMKTLTDHEFLSNPNFAAP